MSKASEKVLGALHAQLAEVFKNALETTFKDDMGNPLPPDHRILKEVREFLKDNHIEVGTAKAGPLQGLAGLLPTFEDDHGSIQ